MPVHVGLVFSEKNCFSKVPGLLFLTGKLSVCHLNLGNNYPGKGTVQLRAVDPFSFRREKYSTRKTPVV
jgi:hypothetical protein